MVNKRKDILENPAYTGYFLILNKFPEGLTFSDLHREFAKIDSKTSKSTIHAQLKVLTSKKENYKISKEMKEKKEYYSIDYGQLINEFLDYVYSEGEPSQRNLLILKFENSEIYPENNKYLIELIKTSLKYASEEADYMLPFIGNKEKEELTIKDIFYSIIKVFIASDISATIEQYFSNTYDHNLKLTNEQYININKSQYPELFILKEIILDCTALWLDFDENLESDIRNNILDLIQKEEFKFVD